MIGKNKLHVSKHKSFTHQQHQNLEKWVKRDFQSRSLKLTEEDTEHIKRKLHNYEAHEGYEFKHKRDYDELDQKTAGWSGVHSHKVSAAVAPSDTLCRLAERRRRNQPQNQMFEDFGHAHSNIRHMKVRPRTPEATDSRAWGHQANLNVERPGVLRLLHSLQDRLEREQAHTRRVEAKLRDGRPKLEGPEYWRSFSLSDLSLSERATAESWARKRPLWPSNSAGHQDLVRTLSCVGPAPRPPRWQHQPVGGAQGPLS